MATGQTRLSTRQKRELLKLTAAAIVSSALALAPLASEQPFDRQILAATSVTVPPHTLPDPPDTTHAFAAARVTRVARRPPRAAPASLRGIRAIDDRPPTVLASYVPLAGSETEEEAERAGSSPRFGGLTRALVGDGRHRVQPFPSPAGSL